MEQYRSIVEVLRKRSLVAPKQVGYSFLENGETIGKSITYEELDGQARAIAAQLQAINATGKRALVVYPYNAGLEFIAAFFGCLYAGVVAVTDNPPRHSKALSQLEGRVVSSGATVGLTTKKLLNTIKNNLLVQNPEVAPELNKIAWIATDEVCESEAAEWKEMQVKEDHLALLQYTSGSTGTPKGIMITHGNILHNNNLIYQCFGHSPESRGLIWLPLFHDMGLIGGVMQPLYGGFPVTLMSPIDLIQQPVRWLTAISRYQATTSGGANFAYDLLCYKITPEDLEGLDLSSWEVAFTGAEPVLAETIERFTRIFAPVGFRRETFYPCYGMAETTLFITGGEKTAALVVKYVEKTALEENRVVEVNPEEEGASSIVGCGRSWLGDKIVIVNPDTLTQCLENQVGEIWVAGAGVGKGYWQQPEETQKTFNAYLAASGDGPFLRTGDLGFLLDGELFITGRIKDLMILWGRNHYPQQIEVTVEKSHRALRPNSGAAFVIEVEKQEQLVIVQEVKRSYLRSLAVGEVVGAIRRAVVEQHLVEVFAVVLIKTGSISKTSSGKIQRSLCREKFLNGGLEIVGEWKQSREIQPQITNLFNL
ncbi:MAG: fatty acyl-AMP ligase [Gomphosphaeria aponina SAG 52.96 = DSM 107014]|uniref:Fatty acyl-AMP ligase n=1 Tax=Gomphosphaeria aponina SAG 52.96 = DSM 107014 TaxID=1521640 RepID=A0A941JQH2_9CHRO|nr:fatty acyl-AMP ligase [Gomphosphaeria aponina SAG 52.96 = DSM 107014]